MSQRGFSQGDAIAQSEGLIKFFHSGKKLEFKKNNIILRAREEPQGVYFVEKGFVKVFTVSREQNEHNHIFYSSSNIFPIIWAFHGAIRNVSYRAMSPATIYVVSKDEFMDFIKSDNEACLQLLYYSTNLFKQYAARIDNLLYSNSYDKIAYRLLTLLDQFGELKGKKLTIKAPITQLDIGNSISLSREMTSRVISRMQKRGVINYDSQHNFVIKDLAPLFHVIGNEVVEGMWPELYKIAITLQPNLVGQVGR
ncbi:MAG TPA: Crp/Fnr family transcriptional regulator [Candidatus Saccharimonadales bacterium]|nr:Crp/Fnr family transcriptional regulator [Candidatus Saccharimonadales bacterium]